MTTDSAPLTAGQRLRQAREQRGLSVQQVALQLNLKAELVTKLEQDQLEGTLETFARGYVRAYARLLKLPEAELMAAVGQQSGSDSSKANPMRTFSNRTAKQATENRFMWLTYAIVALLLLLLFVWWWQSELITSPTSAVLDSQITPEIISDQQAEESELVLTEPTAEQLAEMLQQLNDSAQASVGTEPEPIAPQLDQLEMRFSANCWVDVIDAEGNRVAYGTKQAGYIMQLSGTAPFVVTLGNPSVVQINFNQQAVDMSALPGGRVAKFSIPESE
ncbi:RodZ domain-containing protein [Rheinheimera sp.]|uniref:RodZ domain-containing protein n=1 Tax=Rheinheimera sp. TaxID=1869214 RepID=UPI004048B480